MQHSDNTTPLSVDNAHFLCDRLAKDCAPLQFVREFQMNCMEAISRAQKDNNLEKGTIIWDYDEGFKSLGIYKLTVTDNGDGMTARE